MDNSFVQAPVNVPKLSGFDKSHQNLLTMNVGTLCPVLCDVLIPGSKVKLDFAAVCQLAPLVSDTFMRVSLKTEAFFVPFRLLAGSFESWFTDEPRQFIGSGGAEGSSLKGTLPVFGGFSSSDATTVSVYFGPQTLSDYLGFRSQITTSLLSSSRLFTLMPFLAYHRVYHDWYRNSLVQRDVFLPPATQVGGIAPSSSNNRAGTAPYCFFSGPSQTPDGVFGSIASLSLADGVGVFELRQRNFGLDYFTTASPTAQQGTAESISFNTSGSTGSFSIAALRAANSLQQFKERNNLAGNLYVEQLYARYGVRPSDGVAQRSLFLGSDSFDVYSKGVYQTNKAGSTPANYFNDVATKYGDGVASGKSSLIRSFEAKEPGYLLVICSLVPRATYSSGIDRKFFDYVGSGSLTDLANPILQNVGPQPIYQSEVNGDGNVTVFGYTDRYAHFKTMSDELHGFMCDGQNLDSFAAQRNFPANSTVTINSAFLKIPDTFLDQVMTVGSGTSGFAAWLDTYFDYKVSQPLAKYSLPSLQDPAYEHGRTIMVNRGGIKL